MGSGKKQYISSDAAKDFERFCGKYKILPKDTFSAKSPEFG